jgi:acetyl esterase/lipase
VRSRAAEWNIDPKRVGILGFSAGGATAGLAATMHAQRQYTAVDAVDEVSCRPDFAALIYPGGLTKRENPWELDDYVKIDASTPPMFLAHAYDDRVSPANSLLMFAELKKAGVPAELHVYATGGHGYGMRNTGHPVNSWTDRCAEWMKSQGYLKP